MRIIVLVSALVLACSCASQKTHEGASTQGQEQVVQKGLSRMDSQIRSKLLSEIRYDLKVVIPPKAENFSGQVQIRFVLSDNKIPLRLDFQDGAVQDLKINGIPTQPVYNGSFVTMPANDLKVGLNTVSISYTHAYTNSGVGLYKYTDPQDGEVYVYTQFEPYDANRFFPCFDQPDLKAAYRLQAEVPTHWVVVSSALEEKKMNKGKSTVWVFPESQRISTYLISLHAGPYKFWSAHAGNIPLRLFARKSFAKYVNHQDWLKFTSQGMKFYSDYFKTPYPFKKYDQVIVPDFAAGGMENVAAVTFSERYTTRGKPTQEERESLASVLLHEMAHIWFGDLVTTKWWNDLWLNEAFATFMQAMTTSWATEFRKAWVTTSLRGKQEAYLEDQLVTTHPITSEIESTEEAFANFDGITYNKGAAVLRQLMYLVGPEKFRDGLALYFKKYAYKNTDLSGFVAAIQEASGHELGGWVHEWLQTAGVNQLEAKFECRAGRISSFALIQSEGNLLREHRAQVVLLKKSRESGELEVQKAVPVSYKESRNDIKELVGVECPDIVFPNYEDYDYVRVKLDPVSTATARVELSRVRDGFLRAMLWAQLWNLVRDGEMSALDFGGLVFSHLKRTEDLKISNYVMSKVSGHQASILMYLPPGKVRHEFTARMEKFAWDRFTMARPGSDDQRLWFDSFVRIAESESAQKRLVESLSETASFKLDQDRRWDVIRQLNKMGYGSAESLRAAELKKDPSDAGKKMSIATQVVRPEMEIKKEWIDKMVHDEKAPFAELHAAMKNMFPLSQELLRAQAADDLYKGLPLIAEKRDGDFQEAFAEELAPTICEAASANRMRGYLEGRPSISPVMNKALWQNLQEFERCVKNRRLAASK